VAAVVDVAIQLVVILCEAANAQPNAVITPGACKM